ncbi:MAG TPA: hypothetical protein VKM72_04580 [Thermoanaerobaculia bacterium]|nr:hypothetical protein [Thermoanaerobaculia bacterium]
MKLFEVRRKALTLPSRLESVFDGDAQVGNRSCQVRSLTGPDGEYLEVSGAGRFAIPRGGARIDLDPEPGATEEAVTEALLGPAFALALARTGTFLLHGSAVILPDRGAAGFLGDSGAGKSTLAHLLTEAGGEVALAADDLLAIALTAEGAAVLPHVPQLKLGPAAMAAIESLPPRIPLLGLYALAPAPPEAAIDLGEPLPPAGAAALLVHHTIASILFAEDLLAAHFGFVADLAGRVPLRRLTVPRRLDVGGEVLQGLRRRAM